MAHPHTIAVVIGTRPEAIKMAPLITLLERAPRVRCRIILTGQHRELADSVLDLFEIKPHVDLDFMRLALPPVELAGRLTSALSSALKSEKPELVLAQGDTTSVVATAVAWRGAAYRLGISKPDYGAAASPRHFPKRPIAS